MNKGKHFRKDVIQARIIAGVLLIIIIVLLVLGISRLTKSSNDDKNSQNSQNTEHIQDVLPEHQDTENLDIENPSTENLNTENSNTEIQNSEDETEIMDDTTYEPDKVYIETTVQLRLRKEPNTRCDILDRIDEGTKLEVLETLDGWYKVNYNGKDGYVSATYIRVVEE